MNFVEFNHCIINIDTITSIILSGSNIRVYTVDGNYDNLTIDEYIYLRDIMKKISNTYSFYQF